MMESALEHLGLSPKEIEVYKILLKLGESPVADILKETQDHPQIIYRALDGLASVSLVLVSFRRHRKYVRAEDPRKLQEMAEKKLSKVQEAIPELLALQKEPKEAIVRIFKGKEELRSARARVVEELPEGGVYYIIGGSGKNFFEIMGEQIREIESKRIKKRIIKKTVTFESQRKFYKIFDKFAQFSEIKYLAMEYPTPTSTGIYLDKVLIYIFSEVPLVIEIESKEVAQSYRHYFEALWKVAEE